MNAYALLAITSLLARNEQSVERLSTDYLFGIIFALAAALSAAMTQAVLSKPIMKSDISGVAFFTVLVGLVISGVLTFTTNWIYFLQPLNLIIIGLFATAGISQYGISRRFFYYSIRNLGANVTSPIITMTLTVGGVLLGILLLREHITSLMIIGIALVIAGGMLLEVRRAAGLRGGATRGGYAAAVSAGIIPAFGAVLISYGLSIYPHVIPSVFISFSAASIYFLLFVRPHSVTLLVRTSSKKSILAFIVAGVFALLAQLFRAGALNIAPVVLVIPFSASSNLFIPLLTWRLAKNVELFNLRTMVGIVIVTMGLILVSI